MNIKTIKKYTYIAVLSSLLVFPACDGSSTGQDVSELELSPELILTWHLFQVNPFDDTTCERGEGSNLYLSTDRFYPLYNDLTEYNTVIIGDSTMDFSRSAVGFFNPAVTQIVAVMGNTFCDMNAQMKAIRSTEPRNVVIASAGGNNLLAGNSNEQIIELGKTLINKVRARFPEAKIVMVGVHPTLKDHINANKVVTNTALESHLDTLSNTCWVDPLSLFGVNEGEAAPVELMLTEFDQIHYNQDVSLGIRDLISSNCSVSL